jgi:aspartyl-tRNA(Asn)/glutamyl-tRNA(Gln) amidotransferase subunit C
MTYKDPSKTNFIIGADTVKHMAFLVRLGINEAEAQAFSQQFSEIIDYFRRLNEVDTRDIPPACETSSTYNVLRPDEVHPSMSREEFMKNVPHRDGEHVQVPFVFGEE